MFENKDNNHGQLYIYGFGGIPSNDTSFYILKG